MTVYELIRELEKFNPDFRVLVDGYESGLDEPTVRAVQAGQNPDPKGYDGTWIPEDDDFERPLPDGAELAVVIGRKAPEAEAADG